VKRISLITAILFFLISCQDFQPAPKEVNLLSDLEKIREDGKMIVVTDYNSTNYFIYRGQPMGYQFDLLQELADYMGVKLEVTVSNNLSENFGQLLDGEVDLIASNLTITKDRKKFVEICIIAGVKGIEIEYTYAKNRPFYKTEKANWAQNFLPDYYRKLADKFNLLKSGGSDYHGGKKGIEIGEARVPLEYLKNYI